MRRLPLGPVLLSVLVLGPALACGGSGSPSSPSTPGSTTPPSFAVLVFPGGKKPDTVVVEWSPVSGKWDDIRIKKFFGSLLLSPSLQLGAVGKQGGAGHRVGQLGPSALTVAKATGPLPTLLLLTGGYGADGNATNAAVLFNSDTNQGTALTMTASRLYQTETTLADSSVLVTGGYDQNNLAQASAEIYSPSTGAFAATGSMTLGRATHAAALLQDGRVLVTGGLYPTGNGVETDQTASAEIFDPSTGKFTATGSMTVARFNHSAITLDDGRVLVLGGNLRQSAEVFNPVSGTFSALPDMKAVHGRGHKAVKLLTGKVLVLGGDSVTAQATSVAELFDPGTNTFTLISPMTTSRYLHFAALMPDGRVLIGGGQNDAGDVLASAEIYDPTNNSFTATADMPRPGEEQAAAFITR